MEKVRYMISDAAALAGVETHVLRYWEEELDLTIPRNEMGQRYFRSHRVPHIFLLTLSLTPLQKKSHLLLFYHTFSLKQFNFCHLFQYGIFDRIVQICWI